MALLATVFGFDQAIAVLVKRPGIERLKFRFLRIEKQQDLFVLNTVW